MPPLSAEAGAAGRDGRNPDTQMEAKLGSQLVTRQPLHILQAC